VSAKIAPPFCEYIVLQYPSIAGRKTKTRAHLEEVRSLVEGQYPLLRQEHYEVRSLESERSIRDSYIDEQGVAPRTNHIATDDIEGLGV